ncbi:MAG TPA: tetratricopeptide repeat protein [Tepidisphaeraceae bacterium]|nr:tetratricopeptide repeat protein [Tepidisphaeraceae bacterium]
MSSPSIPQLLQLATDHHRAGRLREAEPIYRQILAIDPQHADTLHGLAFLVKQSRRLGEALALVQRAIGANAKRPAYWNSLGLILIDAGRIDEAADGLQKALALDPNCTDALINLGGIHAMRRQWAQAAALYRRVLVVRPGSPEALTNLGNVLQEMGKRDEAIVVYRQTIALRPRFAQAHDNLGTVLEHAGQLEEAAASYRQAVALQPDYANALNNLGHVCAMLGQLDEALDSFRRATVADPTASRFHSNLLYWSHFHPAYGAVAILREHQQWNTRHAEPLRRFARPFENDRSPRRRLRIGYVSPDFHNHTMSLFTTPVLANHDRDQFEVFCYASDAKPDDFTDRLRGLSDHWRNILPMTDDRAAEQMRHDRIDILVDLSLHMGRNRLLVFARKPAPLQVTWLGYPGTTGLWAMDYRLTDPHLDPPGDERDRLYVERSVRLPHAFWCYDPRALDREDAAEIAVSPPPVVASGSIMFGCLNNFAKVHERVLAVWSRVLAAVPGSRLLLLAPPGSHRQRVADRLSGRVQFVDRAPRRKYLASHAEIDIALDTFPANGHTTSLDALYMGVPAVTLLGETAIARGGLSVLSNVGLMDLVARSPDEYVEIARKLANDRARLAELRATLRDRLRASPLMDWSGFVRGLEARYREMWIEWVRGTESK